MIYSRRRSGLSSGNISRQRRLRLELPELNGSLHTAGGIHLRNGDHGLSLLSNDPYDPYDSYDTCDREVGDHPPVTVCF